MRKPCPLCQRRRQLGRCKFGGHNAVIPDHCRACCSAPDRDSWKASPAPKSKRIAAGA